MTRKGGEMDKECGNCTYKYSCGYGAPRSGKETRKCIEPHLYKEKEDDLVWSPWQQKLLPEIEVRREEDGTL